MNADEIYIDDVSHHEYWKTWIGGPPSTFRVSESKPVVFDVRRQLSVSAGKALGTIEDEMVGLQEGVRGRW